MNRLSLSALMLTIPLAACGGGSGGGGPLPVTQPPTHTNSVALHGGFNGSTSFSSSARRPASVLPMDVNFSALPPTGMFDIPDSYINGNPDGVSTEQMYAYLTTTDGTMNGIPNPLPVPQLTQSGPGMPLLNAIAAPALPSAPPVGIGGFNLGAPTQPGHTTALISAVVNGQTLSATLNVYSYGAGCVASTNNNTTYNCPTGLYWDASGVEHTTTDISQADILLQFNSGDGSDSLVFPYGAVELTKTLVYAVTQVPTVPTTSTAFAGKQLLSDTSLGGVTFVFHTKSGLAVKFGLLHMDNGCNPPAGGGSGCDPNFGASTGSFGDAYGVYAVATGTTFDH